mgnify:CR=1 FL=1
MPIILYFFLSSSFFLPFSVLAPVSRQPSALCPVEALVLEYVVHRPGQFLVLVGRQVTDERCDIFHRFRRCRL